MSYFLTVELHQRVTFDCGTPCTNYFLTVELRARVAF